MTTQAGARWVNYADTNPRIAYEGPWFERGQFGPSTPNHGLNFEAQHGVNETASLSVPFKGSAIRVRGRREFRNPNRQPGQEDATWECIIDGETLSRGSLAEVEEGTNNWVYCDERVPPGEHILQLRVNVTDGTTFWVDQIRFLPTLDADIDPRASVLIEQGDPAVQYVSGRWNLGEPEQAVVMTLDVNATIRIHFSGVMVTWIGWTVPNIRSGPSTGTWAIDGNPPRVFDIPEFPEGGGDTPFVDQQLIVARNLAKRDHVLTVTYRGPGAPLTFDSLLVVEGSIFVPDAASLASATAGLPPVSGIPGSIPPFPSSTSSNDESAASTGGGSSAPVGAIVGGVIGGLSFIAITLVILFFIRRMLLRREAPAPAISQFPPGATFESRSNGPATTTTTSSQSPITPFNASEGGVLRPRQFTKEPIIATPIGAVPQSQIPRQPFGAMGGTSTVNGERPPLYQL